MIESHRTARATPPVTIMSWWQSWFRQTIELLLSRLLWKAWWLPGLAVLTGVVLFIAKASLTWSTFVLLVAGEWSVLLIATGRMRSRVTLAHPKGPLAALRPTNAAFEDRSTQCLNSRGGTVTFREIARVALVDGDPGGSEGHAREAMAEFLAFCQRRGWAPAAVGVSGEHLAIYQQMGFQARRIGREAVIDLAEYVLRQRRLMRRTAMVAGEQSRALHAAFFPDGLADQDATLGAAATECCIGALAGARHSQLHRSGLLIPQTVQDDLWANPVVLLMDRTGAIHGVAVWRPGTHGPYSLELAHLARSTAAPAGTRELLLTAALGHLAAAGYRHASLGMIVEAADDVPDDDAWVDATLARLNDLGPCPSVAFLELFEPLWQDRYLLYTHTTVLPHILYAVLRARLPYDLIALPVPGLSPATHLRAPLRRQWDHGVVPDDEPRYRAPGGE